MIISRLYGAVEQGVFASTKSLFDLAIAAACFGFPQSVIIAINKYFVSRRYLYIYSFFYSFILLPFVYIFVYIFDGKSNFTKIDLLMISIGVCFLVTVNIWRGILLTLNDGYKFHLITALQSIMLVFFAFLFLIIGFYLQEVISYVCFLCGIFSFLCAYKIIPWKMVSHENGERPNLKQLTSNGADVFLQAMGMNFQIFVALAWINNYSSLAAVGYFGVAIILVNAFGFPLQSIAPILLNRWSQKNREYALTAGNKEMIYLSILAVLGVGAIVYIAPWFIPYFWGADFSNAVPTIQVMLLCVIPMLWLRVGALRLAAIGAFRVNSLAAVARCVLFCLLLGLNTFIKSESAAMLVALSWLVAEIFSAVITTYKVITIQRKIHIGGQ